MDFTIRNQNGVFIIAPQTEAARVWIENCNKGTFLGDELTVDFGSLNAAIQSIQENELTIEEI